MLNIYATKQACGPRLRSQAKKKSAEKKRMSSTQNLRKCYTYMKKNLNYNIFGQPLPKIFVNVTKILNFLSCTFHSINVQFFFIEMSLKQWVFGRCQKITDVQRVLNYLNSLTEEDPTVTIPYIFQDCRMALSNDQIFNIMEKRIQNWIQIRGPNAADELYTSLNSENPEIIDDTGVIYMLSMAAPIIFWKYFNPAGKRVHNELHHNLYTALDPGQRKTYAAAALRLSGYLLEELAVKYRTKSLCMIAVTKDGPALKHVPTKIRTNKIVKAAISQSASAMEYATPVQRIRFIELAVMGSGEIFGHSRPGGFSKKDWTRPWAMEVWAALSDTRKEDLEKRWKKQREDDANRWHNDNAR